MTGDDHGERRHRGPLRPVRAAQPAGCSVADWECIRGTSYIYPNTPLTNAQAAAYERRASRSALHLEHRLRATSRRRR